MKKVTKKLMTLLFAAILAAAPMLADTVSVQAAEAQYVTRYSQTITLYDSASAKTIADVTNGFSGNLTVLGGSIKPNKPTKLSTSNKSVVTLGLKNGTGLAKSRVLVCARARKAGKAVVSYKIGDITYKATLTVKKYASPLAGLKLGTSNLTSKVSKKPVYNVSYKKYANKKVKLTFRPKAGWSVSADYTPSSTGVKSVRVENNGYFKVTKKNSALVLMAYNERSGQSEEVIIRFV